jgi:Protein of unknown function (DUF2628)
MTIFTVHLPNSVAAARYDQAAASGADDPALARAVFVPEGFSRGAFIFGPLWLLSRGLWLAFFVWVVLVLSLSILVAGFLTSFAAFWIFVAIEFLLGLEGNNLRRRKLERRGYRCVEVVTGTPQDAAERAFFSRWTAAEVALPAPSLNRVLPASDSHSEVLGHFPLPGGRG